MIRLWVISALVILLAITTGTSRNYIVDDDGFADSESIGGAVRAASDGDIIYIKPGVYSEEVLVDKTLTIKPLLGERGECVLRADGKSVGIKVAANGCTLEGLTITGYSEAGILLTSSGNSVKGNTLRENRAGVIIEGGESNRIENNRVEKSTGGIVLYRGARSNSVAGNEIIRCNYSIIAKEAYHNIIERNNITTAGEGLHLINATDTQATMNSILDALSGIVIEGSSRITLSGCVLNDTGTAIALGATSSSTAIDNVISSANDGIVLVGASSCLLERNSIEKVTTGLMIVDSFNNTIRDNGIRDAELGLFVDGSTREAYSNSISDTNLIDGMPVVYVFNQSNARITDREAAHMTVAYCDRCDISRNMVAHDALFLYGITNSTVEGNTLRGSYGGIRLIDSTNNSLKNNTATGTKYTGIFLRGTAYNLVQNNSLNENGDNGLALILSYRNSIEGNFILNNTEYGIRSNYSGENEITGNTISGNKKAGIWFDNNNKSIICGNNITNNVMGILMTNSYENRIYHNNLIDNGEQASDEFGNFWDMGPEEGGNYWSDHRCTGRPCTGFAKLISANAIDRYPFGEVSGWTLPREVPGNITATNVSSANVSTESIPSTRSLAYAVSNRTGTSYRSGLALLEAAQRLRGEATESTGTP
ncbi:MAG TPA: NosD domain-containing protein [Methanothrix sp.]|nr:NosD domain-containing protein [Methanothrix sp.]HOK58051.1 NosD domain-containing protein [Methanothrix sp.]HOL43454.1 NosD domain-containing protein [Methanothrix sp.]HPO88528.1 NosD domain-containing protein [Methanothrix sp.]